MAKNFLSINANYNDFISIQSSEINKFLLENQEPVLSKVYGFFQKNENLLLITGFFGTGKYQITRHMMNYIDKEVLALKFECSQASTLDDLLLNFWYQLVNINPDNEHLLKYNQNQSFQEKFTDFLAEIPTGIIISLYNFELVSSDNAQDILNFLWSLANDDKVKIVITAKTFDTALIPDDIIYTKVILRAFSRSVFEKCLHENNIKATSRIFDELYKITRGYYFYTEITARILSKKNLSVNDFLVAYTNSGMSFDKFLAKAYISMLPEACYKLLSILSVIRHPINSSVLDYFEAYDIPSVDYLKENLFIKTIADLFIVNNYFRTSLISDLDKDAEITIRQNIVKFYNAQLALNPNERLLVISRNTMRSEIDYHSNIINPPAKDDAGSEVGLILQNKPSEDLFIEAENNISNYNYKDALKIYISLLDREDVDKYTVYDRLLYIYDTLGNWKYALHYANHLVKYYREKNDSYNVNLIKLRVAKIYYQSYKTNDAINILTEIISETVDTKITIDAYTLLGNIYISLATKNKAYELYNKAVTLSEREIDLTNLSELYFKFAILSDENDDTDTAVRYYKKCIEVSEDTNKYKSLSYSNLGDFYLDINDKDRALENFKKAYEYDEINSNSYGMYYAASNAAKLLVHKDPDEAHLYLLKSKRAAKKSNDIFAIANACLHLGDFFTNTDKYELALKEYFYVQNLVKDKFSQANKNKINRRIEEIKLKIGEKEFNELCTNPY